VATTCLKKKKIKAFFKINKIMDKIGWLTTPKGHGVVRPPPRAKIGVTETTLKCQNWGGRNHPQEGHPIWPKGGSTTPVAHEGGLATPKGQSEKKLKNKK